MEGRLADFHRQIRQALVQVDQHCSLNKPDILGIMAVRERLRIISVSRGNYVERVLTPRALVYATGELIKEIGHLRKLYAELRFVASMHVARWTSKDVTANWPAFKLEARVIRDMMIAHMNQEAEVFGING